MKRSVSLWDSVFYRLWRNAPANGFPDRSFALVAVMQFVWAMLPLLIAVNLTIKRIALPIPIFPDIIGGAAICLFAAFILYCGVRYTEKRYRDLHKTISTLPFHKWKTLRSRTTHTLWLSAAVFIADILLVFRLATQ